MFGTYAMHSSEGQNGVLTPVLEFLRQYPPFNQMEASDLEFLAKRLRLIFYPRGELITSPEAGPAQSFHIIKQGRVHAELAPVRQDNTEKLMDLGPGECFPVGALLSRRPVRAVYQAAEDTFCFELDYDDFHKLLKLSNPFNSACTLRLANLLDQAHRQVQSQASQGLGNDTSLNIRLAERIRRAPITCTVNTSLREVLHTMDREHVGSMIVVDEAHRPIGVFTLHDLLNRVTLPERSLDDSIETVMSPNPITLTPAAFAFEAAMLMAYHGFHHVCVVDQGKLVGVISERDLFSLQRVGLVNLSRAIHRAQDIDKLARFGRDIHLLIGQMIAQGVRVEQITQIITLLNDHVTRRAIEICMAEHPDTEISFSWLAFGSEGRAEQTLKTDQDNGILFSVPDGQSADAVRAKLLPLALRINQALDQCGFPLCTGNIMASNPECCLSFDEWRQRFARWIDQGTPEHLLKSSIFFDFRVLMGPAEPADSLRAWLLDKTAQNSRFRRQMAANAMGFRPPLGFLGDFRVATKGAHRNTLDLKLNGVTPIVDAARIIALSAGVQETNTTERLRRAASLEVLNEEDVAAWIDSSQYIQMLRMRVHQQQALEGKPLSNHVNPDLLNDLDQRILKEAFRQVRKLQSRLATEYQL